MKLDEIISGELEDWLSALPEYQADSLRKWKEAGASEDEIMEKWVIGFGSDQTNPFGTSPKNKNYFEQLQSEFKKLICGDSKYGHIRDELLENKNIIKGTIIYIIAAAIGAELGLAAALIAPVVAVLLYAVGKVTVEAWCATEDK